VQIGDVLGGKYRLDRLIGDGGMGTVYEAEHVLLGVRVAVKVLHSDLARRPGLGERFLQEARVAAQIRSPYVVQVTDVDKTPDGIAYLVMELLDGEPLATLLERDHTVPLPAACELTLQMLHALEAAHALGVIHRDLKPENVFLTSRGSHRVLKLIDFGIAKLRSPGTKNMTAAGVLMGTAEYMAPEQVHAASDVDGRSDLYSVGVLLFEMLAGRRPVAGENAVIIALKVERGDVISLRQAAPQVPEPIVALVHRAMAAKPEQRFASATEMRLALEAARDAAGNARPGRPSGTIGAFGAAAGQPGTAIGAPLPQPGLPPANLGTGTELGAPLPPEVRAAMSAPYTSVHAMSPALGTTTSAGPANGGYGPPGGGAPAYGGYGGAPGPRAGLAVATPYGQAAQAGHLPTARLAPPGRRMEKKFPWWALIAAVVLGGAAVGGILAYNYYADDDPPHPPAAVVPTVTPPNVATITPPGTPTVPPETPLPPLATPRNGYVPGTPRPHPSPSASGSARPSPSSQPPPGQNPNGIPQLSLPSAFPNPFGSAFPNIFPQDPGPSPNQPNQPNRPSPPSAPNGGGDLDPNN
jgi:tRNA A-37 threonylcarbamoyl transferase component Bud32